MMATVVTSPAALDHLVYAVPDLESGCARFAEMSGVSPVRGGAHPGRGTTNALVGLEHDGRRTAYLELLGPDPQQPDVPPERTMLGLGLLGPAFRPRLLTWAVRPDDLDRTVAVAGAAGVDVGAVAGSSRRTPDGLELAWRLSVRVPLPHAGLQPFLIDWGGGAHPSDADLPVVSLAGLHAEHPNPRGLRRALEVLATDLEVREGAEPALVAELRTPRGRLVLR